MAQSTTSETVQNFSVPECLQEHATWPGDIILRAWHGRTQESEGQAVDFYCHSGWKESCDTAPKDGHPRRKRLKPAGEGDSTCTEESASVRPTSHILGTIEMQDESAELIRDFLCFMYRKLELELHKDNWAALIKLADKVGMPALVNVSYDYAQDEVANMPLQVFQWCLRAGDEADLFEESSQILVASLPEYKTQAQYVELPIEIRLLLEESRARWLEMCAGVIHSMHHEMNRYGVTELDSGRPLHQAVGLLSKQCTASAVQSLLTVVRGMVCADPELYLPAGSLHTLLRTGLKWQPVYAEYCAAPLQDA